MDGDVGTSQSDQISLYGLFGDSSATLQGLNDHLSPSLLQQSPPCGSSIATQTIPSKAITSPTKIISNGSQQGVLLSDLADRSPSAGSVTAASLCSHVSFDNLRCTNLVSGKGDRFCSQHSKEVKGIPLKGMAEKPPPSSNLKKTVTFASPTAGLPSGSQVALSVNSPSIIRPIKAVKLGVKPMPSGGVTSKTVVIPDQSNIPLKGQQHNQVCFVRKVGQQITVTTKPIGVKTTDANPKCIQTFPNVLNPIGTMTTASSISKSKSHIVMKSGISGNSTAKVTPRATQTAVSNAKHNGMDEVILKKVVGVLNSRNDLTSQQQISLLQSMGITVVHGSPANAKTLAVRRKKPSKQVVRRVITIGNSKSLQAAVSSPFKSSGASPTVLSPGLNQVSSRFTNGLSSPNILPPIRPLPSAMESLARQAATTVRLPVPSTKVQPNSILAAGDVPPVIESLARQAVRCPNFQEQSNKAGIKGSGKVPQKRKEKSAGGGVAKKTKLTAEKSNQAESNKQAFYKNPKHPRLSLEKLKQQKKKLRGQSANTFLSANPPPRMLRVPEGSADCIHSLCQHLNKKMLIEHSLFQLECVESGDKVEADKHKTLKTKLLKKHLANKQLRSIGAAFGYKECVKDLKGSDICKTFSAAEALLDILRRQSHGKKTIVHHEKILEDLMEEENAEIDEFFEENVFENDIFDTRDFDEFDGNPAFTLRTIRIKDEYNRLVLQLKEQEEGIKMLLRCLKEDPVSTFKVLRSMTETKQDTWRPTVKSETRRCHLPSDNGLCCNAHALPYASYCRQHIWYCQNQCLYKLDQNMKPIADIAPDPMVKKVRKRTKLLPLIKRYKKKKRRKVDGNEGHDSAKEDSINLLPLPKQDVKGNMASPGAHMHFQHNGDSVLAENVQNSTKVDESDLEDVKPSDSSEDDLNLTTNEIMLSGVLDKLPDDPHDFDLFTTDKGAEELERALMLAATSPSPEHGEGGASIQEYDSHLLPSAKVDGSPNAIINCDAPKSNEQPPLLESFDKSQCVHYTFGSSLPRIVTNDAENDANGFDGEDEATRSIISAEDLKEIEGVLERLHAEDANSPKLPSSPAVDQYTSMLARQLSQEVETESLKQQSSPSELATAFTTLKEPVMLSHSYSLTTSSIRDAYSEKSSNDATGMVPSGKELQQSNVSAHCSVSGPSPSSCDIGNAAPSLHEGVSRTLQPTASQIPVSKIHITQVASHLPVTGSACAINQSSMQGTTKAVKEVTATTSSLKVSSQGSVPMSPKTPQPKASHSPTVVSSPVLPVTLMQSPSQSGNVIKVIVPPGTMVNGTNGQQNMLLIPVSALMKPNAAQGNQNIASGLISGIHSHSSTSSVRTQLSNLQTGQQFFIVNNHAGTSQTHLALVQKPVIGATQRHGVFVKPTQKSVASQKDETANLDFGNCFQSNVKLNLNEYLKQNRASIQQALSSSSDVANTVTGKPCNAKLNTAGASFPPEVSMARNVSTVQTVAKLATGQGVGRRVKNLVKKVKAKAKFDPVAKKYVPAGSVAASLPVVPVSTSLVSSADPNLTENWKKFNASALSIQSKVQQIDSVLSSLNAAKNSQPVNKPLAGGQPEKKIRSSRPAVSTEDKPNVSSPYVPMHSAMTVAGALLSPNSTACVQQKEPMDASLKEKQPKQQKVVVKPNKAVLKNPTTSLINTTPVSSNVSVTRNTPIVPVSSGTVHWNQTTTAGPEITTTTLTVPVYITGAIPAGAWPGDLTLKGSLSGASLPVILPAHKISPHCQVPQRVLLGSIGSLAVRPQVVTVASSPTAVHPSRTIITPVTLPVSGGLSSSLLSQKQVSNTAMPSVARPQQSGDTVMRSDGPMPPQPQVVSQGQQSSSIKQTLQENLTVKRKSGRKSSHSNILRDPLMLDPNALDCCSHSDSQQS